MVYSRSKDQPHHRAVRHSQRVPENRLANGTPARRARQTHPWNQVVSPPCGYRRSEAQRRGIKKAIVHDGTATIAVCEEMQEPSSPTTPLRVSHPGKDGPRAHVHGPDDPGRLRAVAAPARVLDVRDLRFHPLNGAATDLGAWRPNDPLLGEGRDGRGFHQRSFLSFLGEQPLELS